MADIKCTESCSTPMKKQPCPIITHSGRGITRYDVRCSVNGEIAEQLQKNNMPLSSYNLRMYLQNSPNEIERQRQVAMSKLVGDCYPCKNFPAKQNPESQVQYVVRCNEVACDRQLVNPVGLGDGRK